MLKTLSAFLDFCYIGRRNSHSTDDLNAMEDALSRFHEHREIFLDLGTRESISLPRQHSLMHYVNSIRMFGSPNGLCSSITESKHIVSVKETWRRSSRYEALEQMVQSITRLDKLKAMRYRISGRNMMVGSTYTYVSGMIAGEIPEEAPEAVEEDVDDDSDLGPVSGPRTMSSVHLARTAGVYTIFFYHITY